MSVCGSYDEDHHADLGKRVLLQTVGTKSAFRQVGIAPCGAAAFACRLEDLIFKDLRLQFGWRGNPRSLEVVASAIRGVHWGTTTVK